MGISMARLAAAAGLAMALGVGGADASTTFFSDLAGGSYNPTSSWYVAGSTSTVEFTPAMGFTSAFSGEVTQIDAALGAILSSGTITVSLWTDSGSGLGTELGHWIVSPYGESGTSSTALVNIPVSGISLTAGAGYYLEATANGTRDQNDWNQNSAGAAGTVLDNGVVFLTGTTLGAFDVLGVVPEPATWALLLVGVGGLGALLRRRARTSASVS